MKYTSYPNDNENSKYFWFQESNIVQIPLVLAYLPLARISLNNIDQLDPWVSYNATEVNGSSSAQSEQGKLDYS